MLTLRRYLEAYANLLESDSASSVTEAPGSTPIVGIEKSVVPGESGALNAPSSVNEDVRPQLEPSHRSAIDVPAAVAMTAVELTNIANEA